VKNDKAQGQIILCKMMKLKRKIKKKNKEKKRLSKEAPSKKDQS
jgi:hypothetical protein